VPADSAIKAEANPSFCDFAHFQSLSRKLDRGTRTEPMESCFSTEQRAIEGAIAFKNVD
jgi:hypothetical protein